MSGKEFAGKVVLVTGAASGLGRATALAFADAGAALGLNDVDAAGLAETRARAEAAGARAIEIALDISDAANCGDAVARTVAAFGRLDALCNVAGIVEFAELKDITPAHWNRVMAVNLAGPLFLSQAAMPHLIEAHGAIVNVSSAAAFRGQAYTTAYSASKAALVAVTKCLGAEFLKAPVRINAIAPGEMITGMRNVRIPKGLDPELLGRMRAIRPSARPEEMTDLILYLASDRASAVHGATFSIDSGMTVV